MVIWENLISFEFPYHYVKPQSNLAICHKLEGFYQIPFSLTFLSLSYKGIKINKKNFTVLLIYDCILTYVKMRVIAFL